MSDAQHVIWTRRVRHAVAVRGPARAVLYALADRADADGWSWASQATLAEDSGVTDRTVRTVLRDLERGGYVERDTRKGFTDRIRLLLAEDGSPTGTPEADSGPRKDVPAPPRKDVPGGSEGRSDEEPKKDPKKGPKEADARAGERDAGIPDGLDSATSLDGLTGHWRQITGREPTMPDLLALEALPRRIETICRRRQIERYAPPGEIALDVLRWVRDATRDERWGDDRAAFVRRRWRAEDGRVTAMLDDGQIAQLVSRWLPAWRAAVASGAAGSQADADRARAAWDDMIARPGMVRPNRDRPPARTPGTGWLLADDWPEHTRRRAALRAAGGWGAWCDLPPEGDPKRPPKVGALRAAFLAAYASTPALETAA